MTVVDIKSGKRAKRTLRNLPLGPSTGGAGRFFDKMCRDIISDLGGRQRLGRIQNELIAAFCGAATQVRYLNYQVMLGETSELDFATYAQLASTMLRIGSRLGIERKLFELSPSEEDPDEYLRRLEQQQQQQVAEDDIEVEP
jgi:hypothetical protein